LHTENQRRIESFIIQYFHNNSIRLSKGQLPYSGRAVGMQMSQQQLAQRCFGIGKKIKRNEDGKFSF